MKQKQNRFIPAGVCLIILLSAGAGFCIAVKPGLWAVLPAAAAVGLALFLVRTSGPAPLSGENDSRKRLDAIFHSVQTGIVIVDRASHEILEINPAACEMIGGSAAQIQGRICHSFICPNQEGQCPITDLNQTIDNSERSLLKMDGQTMPILKTVSEITLHGRPCLVECFLDLSRQKDSEKALVRSKEEAEAATRAKSLFLANMSHEIRTPMNGVLGMGELLAGTPLSAEQRKYVNAIQTSGEALLSVINDILDYSKIEAGKIELEQIRFNLRPVLEGVEDILSTTARDKGVDLVTLIHPTTPLYLVGDPGRLRQVLLNLVGNAIKFTARGEVVVRAGMPPAETAPDSNPGPGDPALIRFSVTDTGIGIPADEQEKLFDSFSQADASFTRRYGGTGLGLSISKELVLLMGGRIGVISEPDKGSEFWFTARFIQSRSRPAAPIKKAMGDNGRRVLVAAPGPTRCQALQQDIEAWGFTTRGTDTKDTVLPMLKAARDQNRAFALAVIEQGPGLEGETLGREILREPGLNQTRLVLITATGEKGDARRFLDAGFSAYLTRPLKQSMLRDCLADLFQESPEAQPPDSVTPPGIITCHSIAERQWQGRYRILLAEDNRINQKVALGGLKKLGLPADAVDNGQEAVNALKTRHYDLVLMDCQMPVMDGYEASRLIRENAREMKNPDVKIIALTAHALRESREQCLAAGMDDHLTKPVKIRNLSDVIEKHLHKN